MSASNDRTWRPNAFRRGGDVEHAQVVAVEHDHAGAGTEHGRAGADQRPQRLGQPLALDPKRHHRGLAAGDDQRVQAVEVGGDADLAHPRPERADDVRVRLEIALQRENPDHVIGATFRRQAKLAMPTKSRYQPRGASSCSASSLDDSRLTIG